MRLLFDTNAFIRWHSGKLRPAAIRTVQRAEFVCVSAITAWEIAMKRAVGKLRMDRLVEDITSRNRFVPVAITLRHGDLLRDLPLHHHDPFDRMLIVQALDQGLTILTADRVFELYRVPIAFI